MESLNGPCRNVDVATSGLDVEDFLENHGIFSVELQDDGSFLLQEECDQYFKVKLSPDELEMLAIRLGFLAREAKTT